MKRKNVYTFIDSQNLNLGVRSQGWQLDFARLRIYLADKYNVSGDGDFYCLIEYLDQKNKLLKILVPNKKYSSLLRRFRSYIVHVGDFRSKIEKERGINLRTEP